MTKKLSSITKEELVNFFKQIDEELVIADSKINILIIGGAAIIMQEIRERSTIDIDLAPGKDAQCFVKTCEQHGVEAQVVTVTSTVDFENIKGVLVFNGKALEVNAVGPADLFKLKLERFQRQDPEDIYEIIDKAGLSYESISELVREVLLDFVGNPVKIIMAARTVVETKFPEKCMEFREKFTF
jgi:hypothetical protein